MAQTAPPSGFLEFWRDPAHVLVLALALGLVVALAWWGLRRQAPHAIVRRLLGRLATERGAVGIFLRAMFVPNNELFSRSPEYPPTTSGALTVHKWTGVPEVHASADVRATAEVLRLLLAANPAAEVEFRSVERDRKVWNEDAVAIGRHFKSQQILDACEPRLVAYRHPDAFRSLVSQDVFEAKGGTDYGLVYKGSHAASHRAFWVIMGLGDVATEAAARFLRLNARPLLQLTGGAGFAAIVSVDSARGPESATLRLLQPRPAWWRRLWYRGSWQQLMEPRAASP